ncbi:NAD(P)H-hydrate dehydratase [Nonlabens ponticola]|uniref:Bifunctional NAD(P)H-hydrate repair enzyme n=1 Tax=Nonlabens ponticola TaxID=2496866 RepID=A0A3S9MZY7_9FLAO|nr:NAD(P)H-hydrate dehydratase [Nonlabens ponticola]AZQ44642.1 NAD(P)H-hydrate dehydratase [Nonlabens ponticola]
MKILSAQQLAQADQATLKSQNITSDELMERVAQLVFERMHQRLNGAPVPIKIFCGIGNNGGDGLAIARHMIQHGYHVTTYITNCSKHRSDDFLKNYERIKDITKDWPILLDCKDDIPAIDNGDIVVDAIFGTGLNRPVDGWMADLFEAINATQAFTVAVDMPSGLLADTAQPENSAIIKADHTFTFQTPKLSFFQVDTGDFVGTFEVIDIGLDPAYINQAQPIATLITREAAQNIYKPRKKFTHKGDYGHVVCVAGHESTMGAAVLCAGAAINAGAGKVTAYIPNDGDIIMQTSLPEVMTLLDDDDHALSDIRIPVKDYVMCIGPGIGQDDVTVSAFAKAIKYQSSPIVIDADGLNILANKRAFLKEVPAQSILTPHDGELERLVGKWNNSTERLEKAKELSKKYDVILVLKGAHTMTVSGDHVYINDSGNPGMATAGSGDVLAGMISSLIAQGYEPLMAAVFGVYIHGAAGDLVAQSYAHEGLKASLISNFIGAAILQLFRNPEASNS